MTGSHPNRWVGVAVLIVVRSVAAQEKPLADARESLQQLDSVGSRVVGYGGKPSKFYKLMQIFLKHGSQADFDELLSSTNPIVRAMGLACIARGDEAYAIGTLTDRLNRRELFLCFPHGCVGGDISEGFFARQLLENRRHLECDQPEPLLSAEALLPLDIRALADDRHRDKWRFARKVISQLKRKGLSFELSLLQELRSQCDSLTVIKGIGRIDPYTAVQSFLVACVQSETTEPTARLAAASALTRYAEPAIGRLLASLAPTLDGLESGNPGAQILKTWHVREAHESRMKPIHATRTWRRMEQIKDEVKRAFSNDHPLALPDLESAFSLAILRTHPDVAKVHAKAILSMSARIDEFKQPWNTYSDTVYSLEEIITRREGRLKPNLSQGQWETLLQRIRTAVQVRDRPTSQP